MKQLLIAIIYDGINNSVFQSQVLAPLQKKLAANQYEKIILISYETFSASEQQLHHKVPPTAGLELIIMRKIPFIGIASLWFAALQLQFKLKANEPFELLARGPLAGWLAKKIATRTECRALTIQARGLLAAEYEYTHQQATGLKKYVHKLRSQQFHDLEKNVYSPDFPERERVYTRSRRISNKITIEAVSPALKEYLINTFNCEPQEITIAHQDIPPEIAQQQITAWRQATRTLLKIPDDAYVYCYNGSALPWQCPEETVRFFKEKTHNHKNLFLLILTQDKEKFQTLAAKYLDATQCAIVSVPHKEIYQHLAAADAGILFREKNILNWVSRPTKVLEYRTVGLPVIHNNTVAWLTNINQSIN